MEFTEILVGSAVLEYIPTRKRWLRTINRKSPSEGSEASDILENSRLPYSRIHEGADK